MPCAAATVAVPLGETAAGDVAAASGSRPRWPSSAPRRTLPRCSRPFPPPSCRCPSSKLCYLESERGERRVGRGEVGWGAARSRTVKSRLLEKKLRGSGAQVKLLRQFAIYMNLLSLNLLEYLSQ